MVLNPALRAFQATVTASAVVVPASLISPNHCFELFANPCRAAIADSKSKLFTKSLIADTPFSAKVFMAS